MIHRKLLTTATPTSKSGSTFYGIHDTRGFPLLQAQTTSATLSLGPIMSDRVIWVVVPTMGAGSTGDSTTTSVSIAGQAATLQARQSASGHTDPLGVSYWFLIDNGVLGTSATIEAFHGISNQVHSGLAVFSTSKGALEQTGFYADIKSKSLATSGSVSTQTGGWAFYCAIAQNASTGTNAIFGNTQSFDIGTNEWCTIGYVSPTDGTPLAVGPQPNALSTQNNLLSALSMI